MRAILKNDFIQFLIDEKALRFGDFTLKSGLKSPFFINLGDICSGSALNFVGQAFAQKIMDDFGDTDILFGPPYKGISLVTAAAIAWNDLYDKKIHTCYNRKEAKKHGEAGMFVGKLPSKGDRIIVVDDVLTTGGTKVEAIQRIEETFNVTIQGVIVTVDRRTKNADSGLGKYKLSALVTLPEIAEYLINKNDPNGKMIMDYYEETYVG